MIGSIAIAEEWPYAVPQSRLDFDRLMSRAEAYTEELGVSFDSTYPEWMRESLRQLVGALTAPQSGLAKDRLGNVVLRAESLPAPRTRKSPTKGNRHADIEG